MKNWTGKKFGPFQLKHFIGEGASSVVYEGIFNDRGNPRYGKSVALKIIRSEGRVHDYQAWLHTETEALRKIRHPGIVRLVPIGEYGPSQYYGRAKVPGEESTPYFFAMELLTAKSIRDIINGKSNFSYEWKLELFYQVMMTISYLHFGSVAHRDLKPENIVFRHNPDPRSLPQPVLIDFGLAGHDLQQAASITYASPERLEDLNNQIEIRGPTGVQILWGRYDIYALGVIAYELFNGYYPYRDIKPDSSFAHVLSAVRNGHIEPMRPDIQKIKPLHDLILSMMHRDAQLRPNARTILEQIDTEISGFANLR